MFTMPLNIFEKSRPHIYLSAKASTLSINMSITSSLRRSKTIRKIRIVSTPLRTNNPYVTLWRSL